MADRDSPFSFGDQVEHQGRTGVYFRTHGDRGGIVLFPRTAPDIGVDGEYVPHSGLAGTGFWTCGCEGRVWKIGTAAYLRCTYCDRERGSHALDRAA